MPSKRRFPTLSKGELRTTSLANKSTKIVYAPVEIDFPTLNECPILNGVREFLEDSKEILYEAHITLELDGMYPKPRGTPVIVEGYQCPDV